MVYFEDPGTVIDAPVKFGREYLVSEQYWPAHSKSARNFRVNETLKTTAVLSAERYLNGKWSTFLSKSGDFPPCCVCDEEVEGDFTGTRFVILYRPKGNQTQVDVYGDVQSKVFTSAEAKRVFLRLLESADMDDASAIAALRETQSR